MRTIGNMVIAANEESMRNQLSAEMRSEVGSLGSNRPGKRDKLEKERSIPSEPEVARGE